MNFITVKLITILENKKRIKKRTTVYTVIEVIGVFIPILIINANYAYMKTDNIKENIIVTCGIFTNFSFLRKDTFYTLYFRRV